MTRHIRNTSPMGFLCLLAAFALVLSGCDYARMKEQEAVKTYKTQLPEMPGESIPVGGGIAVLRASDPRSLENPHSFSPELVLQGEAAYRAYCIMCHGPKANGSGTVGQSFYPLPTNLRDPHVQEQTDGELFYKISFGYKRHPPLGYTVSLEDRWAIVHFIRSLANGQGG